VISPSQPKQPTHIAYADETNYNVGRYRGIGLVTLRSDKLSNLVDDLNRILLESNIHEAKWSKLNGARPRFAAEKMFDLAIEKAAEGVLRVDVLTWDTEDSRHRLKGRDDIANLQRMYYHLFQNVFIKRYPRKCTWRLYPDENLALRWGLMLFFLIKSGTKTPKLPQLDPEIILKLERFYNIGRITPSKSCNEPLIQLADLFAGMAVYSRNSFSHYDQWRCSNTVQSTLFEISDSGVVARSIKLSGSDKERCKVIDGFYKKCRVKKLGISLKTNKGFRTFDPNKPINFWWYEPQHEHDKAPTKEK
jgi:hypothetical protein